jgi:arginase
LNKKLRIIHAASILGLKPTGTQFLADRFIKAGLVGMIDANPEIIYVPDLNFLYKRERDADTGCLNTGAIQKFSLALNEAITTVVNDGDFALVLGGDCSVLIGILSALKGLEKTGPGKTGPRKIDSGKIEPGNKGLIFIDAHADFYSPETSITGEVADMDLAIVSGRGPDLLTNINHFAPYVENENIIHIGQRDQDETSKYGSPDIRNTKIHCISAVELRKAGAKEVAATVSEKINNSSADNFWIHFDTDVLDDEINPAVDYRLPGGLNIEEVQTIIKAAISTGRCNGMSITIFNPLLDKDGTVCNKLVSGIAGIFKNNDPDYKSDTCNEERPEMS